MNAWKIPVLLAAALAAGTLSAQRWTGPLTVPPAPAPLVIDGELEPAWFDRAPARDLVNYDGTTNNLIVENYLTMFRTLADENYWYVSFVCSDDEPLATLDGRDAPIYREDICEVMISSPVDRRMCELSVSPRGTVYDAQLSWSEFNRFEVDSAWNVEGLKSAVRRRPLPDTPGRCVWTVELAIPWSAVPGGRPPDGGTLRANILRYKRIRDPKLRQFNGDQAFLSMSIFATGIKGWPAGPSSFGLFRFPRNGSGRND